MLLTLLPIASNAFRESLRQPIALVMVGIAGVLQLVNTWSTGFAMGYSTSAEVHGDNKLLFDIGLGSVFVCAVLLAAFTATAIVSAEIQRKTVLTVVSKPVHRAAVVFGKYLGLAAALLTCLAIMLIFLLMGLRHGVMSMAADTLDGPVFAFTGAALFLALGLAAWTNFFYGWSFSQTAIILLLPFMIIAYVLVLALSKKWEWQALATDFKPQVSLACLALTMAVLVLAAVATAVSTRLGQVMTIVACAGVFLAGLLSNALVGRHVFSNVPVGQVREVVNSDPTLPSSAGWPKPGAANRITFASPPVIAPKIGDTFYFGPSPTGYPLLVNQPDPIVPPTTPTALPPAPVGLIVSEILRDGVVVRLEGREQAASVQIDRAPLKDDWIFLAPTRTNIAALGLWSLVPNMQVFWLLDAVTENQRIPAAHMAMLAGYCALQIVAFLAVGVVLFQTRDVG